MQTRTAATFAQIIINWSTGRNAVAGLVSELDVPNDRFQVYMQFVTLKLIGHCQGCDVTSPSFGLNPELV